MAIQGTYARPINRYGVTEKKKAELDALNGQVLSAQNQVEQLQAVVNSLQEKTNRFQNENTAAQQNKVVANGNKLDLVSITQNVKDLLASSNTAFDQVVLADTSTKRLCTQVNIVINKLIYSAELINKLGNLVVRKKALNPLISNDLVTMITTAGNDANNAVALSLVALKSSFTAQAMSIESEATAALEYTDAIKLLEILTGKNAQGKPSARISQSLTELIELANTQADEKAKQAEKALKEVTEQLNATKAQLSKAQVKLTSLQTGLAAANAAAMAS
jgi:chromosome segregation ATPase